MCNSDFEREVLRRIEALVRGWDTQRHEGLWVEAHRKPDDGLDAAEVLAQHDELVGEHDLREVVKRRAGQEERLERLLSQVVVLEPVDLGVFDECRGGTDLLVVADHEESSFRAGAQGSRGCPIARLRP